MHHYLLRIGQLLLACALVSCEKVIEVDLEEADERLVIEAALRHGEQPFEVLISYTTPYFGDDPVMTVPDARVTLTADNGLNLEVPHAVNGSYRAIVDAEAGVNYTLTVELDGTEYSATSYLPEPVQLSQVYYAEAPDNAFSDGEYNVYLRYADPGDAENFYRVIHSINGVPQTGGEDLQLLNDNLNNGNEARIPIFGRFFDPGDVVDIELIHFDEASYDYFNSLADIVGSQQGPTGGTAAPGNPESNWSGNILGYFSAYSLDSMSVVLPE